MSRALHAAVSLLRSSSAVARLSILRLRARVGGSSLVVAPVALATLGLLATGPLSLLGEDAALEGTLAGSPAADRSVRVELLRFGDPGGDPTAPGGTGLPPTSARIVRRELASLPAPMVRGPTRMFVAFNLKTIDGGPVSLVAIDGITRLRSTTGELPEGCDRHRCEAVLVGRRAGGRVGAVQGLPLAVVGRATGDAELTGVLRSSGMNEAQGAALVVNGIAGLESLAALEFAPRRYYWTRAIASDGVHPWNVDRLLAEISGLSARLASTELLTDLASPARRLDATQDRGHAARQRLIMIAAIAASSLLAFAALGGVLRRADFRGELRRLVDGGARRRDQMLFTVLEPALLTGGGVLLGAAAALIAVVGAGQVRMGDGWLLVRESFVQTSSLAVLVAVWFLATATVALAQYGQAGQRRGWTLELVTGSTLVLVVWQTRQQGPLGARSLADATGPVPELLVLPALLALASALVAARLCPLVLRWVEPRVPERSLDLRVALLSLTRDPGRTGQIAGFVAVGMTLAVFSLSHADRLGDNLRDRALLQAGAELRILEESPSAGTDAVPVHRYARLNATLAVPAVRTTADIAADGIFGGPFRLLGLPGRSAGALPSMRLALGRPATELATTLEAGRRLRLAGPALPAGTRRLRLGLATAGATLDVTIPLQRRDGTIERLHLGEVGPGRRVASAALDDPTVGRRLLGVELSVVPGTATSGEGRLTLGRLTAVSGSRRRTVTRFRGAAWMTTGGAERTLGSSANTVLTFATTGGLGLPALRTYQARALDPLPAVVSPDIARTLVRAGGMVPIRLPGGQTFEIKLAGESRLLPTLGSRFVLVDLARLLAAVNGQYPGALVPGEMWLELGKDSDEHEVRSLLARAPFRRTTVVSRARLAALGEGDPFSRTAIAGLLWAAAIAALIAATGLTLGTWSATRDGGRELVDLEALGVPPAGLRRQLRLAAAVVSLFGLSTGVAGASALSVALAGAVAVGADARDAIPPLPAALTLHGAATVIAGTAVIAAIGVASISGRAFRGREAGRVHG